MTSQKRAALKTLIEEQTRLKTTSKEVAREFLVRQGIYTPDGHLAPNFGGVDRDPSLRKPTSGRQQRK